MVVKIALACLLAVAPLAAQQEERPKVPKDSLLVTVVGCLKGRVLKASDVRQEDTTSGPIVRGHAFRIASKGVTKLVKRQAARRDRRLIRKSSLVARREVRQPRGRRRRTWRPAVTLPDPPRTCAMPGRCRAWRQLRLVAQARATSPSLLLLLW